MDKSVPNLMQGKKVGLLGGSFNPAHLGHRHISTEALRLLALDEIWWLVSPLNPLKNENEMSAYDERLETAKVIACHPKIKISSFEKQNGTRYTIDTLLALKKSFPENRFVWLMGADNLAQFHLWHRSRDIIRQMPIAIFDRKNYALLALHKRLTQVYAVFRVSQRKGRALVYKRPPAWIFFKIRKHNASSTAIRQNRSSYAVGQKKC